MKRSPLFVSTFVVTFILVTGLGCAKKTDDAKISSDVQTRFSQDSGLSSKQLTVQTSAGVVTISGAVDNDAQRDAAARQRKCDAARSDAQLQGPAVGGEVRENVDCRVHDPRGEHVRRRLVVRRRDTRSEVAILIVHRRTVPRQPAAAPAIFRARDAVWPSASSSDQRRLAQPGLVVELADHERGDIGPADRVAEPAAVQGCSDAALGRAVG